MAFIPPQGNKTVMVDNSNNIVYPASFQKVVATQATIAGNNFTDVPSVIDPENATTTQLPSVASVVNYVSDVVEGGSSGLIPAIQSDIQTLGQVKSNRGEFWFNRGILTCANKWTTDTAFSLAFTFAMTQDDWTSMSAMSSSYWINTANYGTPTGINLSDSGDDLLLILTCEGITGVSIYKNAIRITDWENYLDGKSHCVVASFGNSSLAINIDGIEKGRLAIADFVPDVSQLPLTIRHYGQMSRIKYFNFDMSDNDAPYTIDDYIGGKDESPFLNGGGDISLTTADVFTTKNNCTITESENGLTFTATTLNSGYASVNFPIIAGQQVEISWEGEILYTGNHNPVLIIGSSTQALTATSGEIVDIKYASSPITTTAEKTGDYLGILLNSSSSSAAGSTATIKGLKIKVNGALLSLDDYSIKVGATQIIPDVSSNNNDATITGVVMGSKDTSIAKMAQLFYQSQQG